MDKDEKNTPEAPSSDGTVFASNLKPGDQAVKAPPPGSTKAGEPSAGAGSADVERTVFKAADKPTSGPGSARPATDDRQEQVVALTRIRQSIVKQDNSQGFIKAKKAADQALAANKIVLNNRFVLEKALGAGGMGTVYKAKDLRKVEANDRNPYVAVKVLNEGFRNHPDAFVTLQREASRSHLLSHPKIVTVHDFDRDGDIIFMTMELLEGKPLDVMLKDLPHEQALPIIADICEALAFAHAKNIVHSDLKPGNVFVTRDGAKILDFGIARLTNNTDDFDSGSLGALTPAYASYEMITGQEPHPSDDLYAIALIAYEILGGGHPYDRTAADQVLEQGLKPKKLAGLNTRQWAALESALQIKRQDRPASVQQFQQAFLERKKFPVFKVASAILLIGLCVLGYLFFFVQDDVSHHVEQALSGANTCLNDNDLKCAIDKLETVLELQPDNTQVTQRLAELKQRLKLQTIAALAHDASICLSEKQDLICAQGKLQDIGALDTAAPEYSQLQTRIERFKTQSKITGLLAAADNCVSDRDYSCVIDNANQALLLDANNARARKLNVEAQTALDAQHEQEKIRDERYAAAMNKGGACLKNEDYDCAARSFNDALAIKPHSTEAVSLQRRAEFSRQQKAESLSKANKLLDKARVCLDKKNYTCAISNAESALEFVPDYAPAKALRQRAAKEQQAVKSNIVIE